jgi:hypothetical protein
MLKTLKNLLRRLDFYLRDEEFYPVNESHVCGIDDVFGDPHNNPDPIRTRVYWAVRRFWVNHWLCNPSKVVFDVKCAYQRVVRGWDDRAVWSVDYWLDDMMPAILRKLKEDKHGVPMSVFPTDAEYIDEDGNPTESAMDIASARWDEALDKMIAGFEASRRVKDMTYEGELGPYPLYRPKGMPKDEWEKVKHDHYLKSEELRKRDEAIFKEGMALFAEHYWSLWD